MEDDVREEIERRYRRKVIAHPEGIITHHGDCQIYRAIKPICNCGLLHDCRQSAATLSVSEGRAVGEGLPCG
jgi:hypothetical protein